jgi:hypothetical protein
MLEQIEELLDREPFLPFRIKLAGGEEYAIEDPHLVALGKSQLIVCAPKSDRYAILRLNQITSLDVGQTA